MFKVLVPALVVVLCWVWASVAPGAPKPAGREPERDKVVKEFVRRVLIALGEHDFDTYVSLCDVPYILQPSYPGTKSGLRANKDRLRKELEERFDQKPKFDGTKHVVRSIRTLKEAKGQFIDQDAADAEAVLPEGGLVVQVEFDRNSPYRLLIREVDGQFRLVGYGHDRQK